MTIPTFLGNLLAILPKEETGLSLFQVHIGVQRLGALGPSLRQSAPGELLSGARRCLFAEARTRRWARSHGRSRIDRRRLFWRTKTNHRSRQGPKAGDKTPGLQHP